MASRRLINFRTFFIVGIALILAVFCAVVFANNRAAGIIGLCALAVLLLAGFIFFYIKGGLTHKPVTFVLALLLSVSTFIVGCALDRGWTKEYPTGTECAVEGTVDSVSEKPDYLSITLNNLRIDNDKHAGNLVVTVTDYAGTVMEFAKPGDTISFRGELKSVPLIEGWEADGAAFRKNLRFRAYPKAGDLSLAFGKPTPLQRFTSHLYKVLSENLGEYYGPIAFGILTGDKNNLDPTVRDYYSAAGLGHIMAVSGLHIGFISAALLWLLNKCRCNRKITFVIVTAFLTGYLFLADFSPSVVRAVVMCLVGLVTMLNGQRRDALNSLGFAVCVILAVAPFYLYEAGFILSVSAVLGLILFTQSFFKALRKIRIPGLIANAVAVSTAAQIGIFPAMIYLFHRVQLYAILVNILMIPIIMVGYIAIFATAMLTCLIPPAGIALKVAGIPLAFIDTVAQLVAHLPLAQVLVFGSSALFLCYPLYFLASRFFMLKRFKRIFSLCCAVLCAGCVALCDYPLRLNDILAPVDSYGEVTSVVMADGQTYVVGDLKDANAVVATLTRLRVKKIAAVYVHFIDEDIARELMSLDRAYPLKAIYCHSYPEISGLKTLLEKNMPVYLMDGAGESGFACVYAGEKYVGFTFGRAPILWASHRADYRDLGIDLASYKIIRAFMYLGEPNHIYLTNLKKDFLDLPAADYHFSNMDEGVYLFDFSRGQIFV